MTLTVANAKGNCSDVGVEVSSGMEEIAAKWKFCVITYEC